MKQLIQIITFVSVAAMTLAGVVALGVYARLIVWAFDLGWKLTGL